MIGSFLVGVAIATPVMSGELPPSPADLVLHTQAIWTGDPARPWAESLAVREGVIVALGTRREVDSLMGPETKVIDAPGGLAIPGLIDAHAHLSMLGAEAFTVDLRGADSLEEVRRRLIAFRERHPDASWILGQNWDQSLWPGMEFPTAAAIDQAIPDRPVWLRRVDGHAGWANSAALRAASIGPETQPPSDGQIHRDATGTPTGLFIDGAMELVQKAIPSAGEERLIEQLLEAQRRCLAAGLTGVHDAGVSPTVARLLRRLDQEGRLKLRVYGMASLEGFGRTLLNAPPEPSRPTDRFRFRAIKLFADGAMGSRGALLFEPYADDPTNRGLTLVSREEIRDITTQALRTGWQVCTHAIGDAANAVTLDAYEAALAAVPTARDSRLRIEHAQVVRREDVARFRRAGIIASMQPSHASTDMRWADLRLGADTARAQGAYAWQWFVQERVALAFGSDFPVEVENPFWGIYAALTRKDAQGQPPGGWHADQCLTLEETLRGFTAGAAFASFDEERLGTLRLGTRADVTVLDRDLFGADPETILRTCVTHTLIDGEVVYRAP